jgi:tetrapyrrole methylase family protein/MazG family protein
VTPGHVFVVGLGPAGADLLLPAARTALARTPRRFVRTARHPAVEDLTRHGLDFRSFDDVYEREPDLESVYRAIASAVVEEARRGDVVFAVPGSPGVAERTVALLRDAERRGEVRLTTVPGLSFADLAWSRLGVDPMDGARVVDGRALPRSITGPTLIAQTDTRLVLSDVKLLLLDQLPHDHEVVVLQRLGLPDERVATVALEDLDREVEPDHLTSVFVDVPGASAGEAFERLVALTERLRGPGGCPWDAEQTHHSLTRHMLEEAYETVEAIEALPADAPQGVTDADAAAYAHVEEELGDLLFQVVIHSVLAREAGAFTIADVATGIHDKLVHRHPHVFGEVEVEGSSEVLRNWERIKQAEKGRESLVDGISPGLPSLLYALKLYRKAAGIGLEPGGEEAALDRLAASVDRLRRLADADGDSEAALGELLAAAVVFGRAHGLDAESALRGWAGRYRDRFRAMEAAAAGEGVDLHEATPAVVQRLWEAAGPA